MTPRADHTSPAASAARTAATHTITVSASARRPSPRRAHHTPPRCRDRHYRYRHQRSSARLHRHAFSSVFRMRWWRRHAAPAARRPPHVGTAGHTPPPGFTKRRPSQKEPRPMLWCPNGDAHRCPRCPPRPRQTRTRTPCRHPAPQLRPPHSAAMPLPLALCSPPRCAGGACAGGGARANELAGGRPLPARRPIKGHPSRGCCRCAAAAAPLASVSQSPTLGGGVQVAVTAATNRGRRPYWHPPYPTARTARCNAKDDARVAPAACSPQSRHDNSPPPDAPPSILHSPRMASDHGRFPSRLPQTHTPTRGTHTQFPPPPVCGHAASPRPPRRHRPVHVRHALGKAPPQIV